MASEIHKNDVKKGWNILIHDDLLATGGTACAAAELVKQLDAKVAGFTFVINLDFLNGKKLLEKYSNNINIIEAGLFHRFDATNIIKSNLIISIFVDASSALPAVVTRKLFSFKYFLTKDLIPSSSSITKICALNLSIYNFT